ncbi:MAG: DEAD/DEAH box helicase family protein [Candidatus Omnitrophica bacterium]|nr:DEAD/DEAH box helicase family protein [Candidatus Omnitrophota bacterium]
MSNLVDQPILNDAYLEPTRHWHIEPGREPELQESRRPAQYVVARAERKGGAAQLLHEAVPLESVNHIRERVNAWRQAGYPGVSRVTRELLAHWNRPIEEYKEQKQAERGSLDGPAVSSAGRRTFFCQREAVETVIWLNEVPEAEKAGITIPAEHPEGTFERLALKMATGSGKTIVMAMLSAWSICNKVANRQDARFSDTVLVVTPNLTVRDRLAGDPERPDAPRALIPGAPGNYYEEFELVPTHLLSLLMQGKVFVTNWHLFALEDDSKRRGVVKRGVESDTAFCGRVLKPLGKAGNLLVLNDEAHHAYRVYPKEKGDEQLTLGEAFEADISDKEEAERARVWIEGLDRIAKVRGIRRCLDLSATPYFLKQSGRREGEPFGWIVVDFGLLDAIESGVVKIPHIPVVDNAGRKEPMYLRLYQEVKSRLPKSEQELEKGRSAAVLQEVQHALATLATQWKHDFERWRTMGREVPPAMIVICNNTAVSSLLARFVGDDGKVLPELRNEDGRRYTLRIDSKLLKDEGIKALNQTQEEAAKALRAIVMSVGKRGGPGEQVRCVVSVGMLSEGWDAQNVTQILGLRAFSSPLLCEQVIGRGLRRFNYDDLSQPETVDVYGIPFEVLPMAKVGPANGNGKPVTVVKSLPERQKDYAIYFPRVIGYIADVRYGVRVAWDSLPELIVTPEEAPTLVGVGDVIDRQAMPREFHDREEFYRNNRVRSALYAVAARITANLGNRMLFPQVLKAAEEYYRKKVQYKPGMDEREVCLERYVDQMTNALSAGIRPEDDEAGTGKLRPILDPYRPKGSTNGVFFQTSLHCIKTIRSHISHIVCHSPVWERNLAVALERHSAVGAYARNYRLGFEIPYDFGGLTHAYTPDFIVRLKRPDDSKVHVVLEVKGLEGNQDRAKEAGAKRWVEAVNNWGELGQWGYAIVKDLTTTEGVLNRLRQETIPTHV